MNGSDRTPSAPFAVSEDPGGPIFWPYGESDDSRVAARPNFASGLVNLSFLAAAIGRGKRIWLTLAVIGLLIGCGLFATVHPSYSASVSILMSEDPQGAIGGMPTEPLLAQDPNLAAVVVKELGLSMTPEAFLRTYSANIANVSTALTNSAGVVTTPVLVITATAKTASQATTDANAIAVEFLKFRSQTLQGQVSASDAAAGQEVAADRAALATLQTQVKAISAEPTSAAQQLQLSKLQSEERTAASGLSAAETTAGSAKAARQLAVSAMVSGTQILSSSPAAVNASRKKTAIEYVGVPFVGFLMIGLAIVAVGAVTSNRLRRRDDIAAALGVPVRLSVSAYAGGNRISGGQQRAVDVRRIVGYLKSVLRGATRRPASLAIVAVDNAPAVVPLVKALAEALVEERKRVAVADLSGHMLARELGEDQPGVHKTRVDSGPVLLVAPEIGRELETGPLSRGEFDSAAHTAVAEAYASADVVLVAASFDPALGGDYIATWATDAVVVITAGASSAAKIQSVGEMLQASRMRVVSSIVLGADRDDDSLGSPALS